MDDNVTGTPALAGLRVLDASSGIAGPLASMLVADLGAQVVRLDGEDTNDGDDLPGAVMWHRNKTVVPFGSGLPLVVDADLVVTTEASVAAALGLSLDGPPPRSLVHLHLPAWLPGAPVDAITMDRMVQAEFGIARRQTSFGGGPVDGVYPFATYLQGTWGATSAIAALVSRATSGVGQRVVVDPLHGAIVAATTTMFTDPLVSLPSTTVGPGGPNPAFGTYQCADGAWLFLGALGTKFQDIAFSLIGASDIVEHPRIAAKREEIYAVDLRDAVRARIAEGFQAKDRAEWLAEFAEAGCPASPVGDRGGWLDHPQVAAIDQRVELDDPVVGPSVMGGNPLRFSSDPAPVHRARRFADTARWAERTQAPAAAEAAPSLGGGPLAGITVLNLGTVLAGPYTGQLLAALGADVVKVETPKGDEFRLRGYMVNRGQRDISMDLRDPRGHEAFMTLVAGADVVLDNFRPGVTTRLGIDLPALQAANDTIVTTSITGYGGVGPLGMLPGYDPVVQALTGIMDAQGGDAEPVFCTVSVNDVTVACLAALGTCAAVYQVATGRGGQSVSSSLVASSTFMQSNELVRYDGRPPAERGGRDYLGPSALSRFYRCADGWVRVALASGDVAVAAGLVAAAPESQDTLADLLATALGELSVEDAVSRLSAAGAVVARGRDNKELLLDPVTLEDGHLGSITWPDGNTSYLPRQYAAFSAHPVPPMMTTPGMGEHTSEVLVEAGLDPAVVEELVGAGVVVQGEALHSVAGTGYR